jgi:hypothetical protein
MMGVRASEAKELKRCVERYEFKYNLSINQSIK